MLLMGRREKNLTTWDLFLHVPNNTTLIYNWRLFFGFRNVTFSLVSCHVGSYLFWLPRYRELS